MKSFLAALFLSAVVVGAALSAQEAPPPDAPYFLDASTGVSVGWFDFQTTGGMDDLAAIVSVVLSLRGGMDVQALVPLNSWLAVGGGLGAYALTLNPGTEQVFFLDFPMRAVVKIGSGSTFLEPYAGYYLSLLPFSQSFPPKGIEAGLRASLWGLYAEASQVWGASTWQHFALGFDFPLK